MDDLGAALALHAEIDRRRASGWCPGLVDVVPGARSVLLDGLDDPGATATELATWVPEGDVPRAGDLVEIPCTYDGPDLATVARAWGVEPGDVGALHAEVVHVVAFCGFAPGFAYMTGIGDGRAVARLPSPRASVPAGSIGLAGPWTGVYPRASPGGWNLIGRTDAPLWDASRSRPALLAPGDRVRFVPPARRRAAREVPSVERDAREVPSGKSAYPGVPAGERAAAREAVGAVVVRAGALTTRQDGGRAGWAHLGVPPGGALDRGAHHLANRLVGNEPDATVLETTVDGVTLRFGSAAVVAIAGAAAAVTVDGRPAGWALPVAVRPGAVLDVGRAEHGLRSYLAVAGGWEATRVLGSASTDLLSGLGPPALADGDTLTAGPGHAPAAWVDVAPAALPVALTALRSARAARAALDVGPGPRHDRLSAAGSSTLSTGTWTVTARSSRIALRLDGPPVELGRSDELASEGLVTGAVQCLPDGQLVVFLADHPTTGGYPVVAVVAAGSLDTCAQARPGTTLTLRVAPPLTPWARG